jgi:hypothetical protein
MYLIPIVQHRLSAFRDAKQALIANAAQLAIARENDPKMIDLLKVPSTAKLHKSSENLHRYVGF